MRFQPAAALAALTIVGIALTGCTAESTPDPSPTPSVSESAEAAPGTRANPLAVGETIRLSDGSAWSVGATAATEVGDGYVVLPMRILIDWDAIRDQLAEAGQDPADADTLGIDPWASLVVRYIGASGRSYELFENAAADVPNQLWSIGTVYPPAEDLSANVAVSVPAEEIDGGVWTVLNTGGDAVFLAAS
ncbi:MULTISPECIES: hypothetical protein [Microbacterium]|uniref:DUF4352 domain-containing protein n=1 Tax=Microbacterium schleiferi TaxID=69362 RepID=A0ABU7V433_9MICO|nr:hypothetical protein [Microbacterium sp.]